MIKNVIRSFSNRINCSSNFSVNDHLKRHSTTILCIRKNDKVVMVGDGQVSMNNMCIKPNAKKVRLLADNKVITGFAGSTADALNLYERLEKKLEENPGQLLKACVELAKTWRTDRYLRLLEAIMIVADENISLEVSGNGDVLESHDGILSVGSGSPFALAAARALYDVKELSAKDIAIKSMKIASAHNPPSVVDGTLSLAEESEQRRFGSEWIQKACILLSYCITSMCNAQVIFHFFFYMHSMKNYNIKIIAAASLHLGCKYSECNHRLQDIINVLEYETWLANKFKENRVTLGNTNTRKVFCDIMESIHEFKLPNPVAVYSESLKKKINDVETFILTETGFLLPKILYHPHQLILHYIQSLFCMSSVSWKILIAQKAWGYLNDALPLCCIVKPSVLTTAAIFLASKDMGFELKKETKWYELFDVDLVELLKVSSDILHLYQLPQAKYKPLVDEF